MTEDKIRENRLRRMADRQGLQLMKSRLRDPRALGYGTFMLVDIETTGIVHQDSPSGRGYGLTMDDVEEYLTG